MQQWQNGRETSSLFYSLHAHRRLYISFMNCQQQASISWTTRYMMAENQEHDSVGDDSKLTADFSIVSKMYCMPTGLQLLPLQRCLCSQLQNEWLSDTAVDWERVRHSFSPRWSGTDCNSSLIQSCLWTNTMNLLFTGKQTLGFSKAAQMLSSNWRITN